MPIFEFHCKECRGEFKTLRRADKLDDVTCPACGTNRVARLLSVTARTGSDAGAQESCGLPSGLC
jgi:putative FmdB family regulatory protein